MLLTCPRRVCSEILIPWAKRVEIITACCRAFILNRTESIPKVEKRPSVVNVAASFVFSDIVPVHAKASVIGILFVPLLHCQICSLIVCRDSSVKSLTY